MSKASTTSRMVAAEHCKGAEAGKRRRASILMKIDYFGANHKNDINNRMIETFVCINSYVEFYIPSVWCVQHI